MPGVAYDNIVNQRSSQIPERMRVVPGSPGTSYLYEKISQETPSMGERMPPGQPLSPDVLDAIRRWIEAGAEAGL